MICYAKYESKSDLWLMCDEHIIRFSAGGEQALLRWQRKYGRMLLVFDGFKASRYQAFVEEYRNYFYQQIMSVPHLFYDFERTCLPTMHNCAVEAGISFDHVSIGDMDATAYLNMMAFACDWAHEHLGPFGTSVLQLNGA